MTPPLTLYLTNGSCALVPHAVLLHFHIPFRGVVMALSKDGPEGVQSVDGTISRSAYLKIHPLGYVPALDVAGEVVTEVPAILSYLSSLVPQAKLFTDDEGLGRARVAEWLNFLSGNIHGHAFGMAFRPGRYTDDPGALAATRAKGVEAVKKGFARIDERLEGKSFAVGGGLTAADFYLYVFARWGKEVGLNMGLGGEFGNYAALARRVEGLEGVRRAVGEEGLEFMY